MTTITLDDLLQEFGLKDAARLAAAVKEARATLPLGALRCAAKKTQSQIAKALGVSQAAVSRFEGRGDFLLSTLFRYAEAIEGSIDLSVRLGDSLFDIVPFDDEGQISFRLIARSKKRVASVPSLASVSSSGEFRRSSGRSHSHPSIWPVRCEDYASAPLISSDLAANDEAQPLAA